MDGLDRLSSLLKVWFSVGDAYAVHAEEFRPEGVLFVDFGQCGTNTGFLDVPAFDVSRFLETVPLKIKSGISIIRRKLTDVMENSDGVVFGFY